MEVTSCCGISRSGCGSSGRCRMPVYLDSLIWDTSNPAFPHWRARDGSDLLLDVRSTPQCGNPGTQFPLRSFVQTVGPEIQASGILVGGDGHGYVTKQRREALGIELDLGKDALVSDRVDDLIIEIMTREAFYDPTGQTRWKPLRGSPRFGFQLHLGAYHLSLQDTPKDPRARFTTSHPAWPGTLAVFQEDYRQIRLLSLSTQAAIDVAGLTWEQAKTLDPYRRMVPPDHHRKILGAAAIKYRVHWQQLVEGMEEPHAPSTTIKDSFTRGDDAAGLGTSAEGWSWTNNTNKLEIFNNAGEENDNLAGRVRAELDLSSDDHHSEVDVTQYVDGASLVETWTRMAAADVDGYLFHVKNTTPSLFLFKHVGGFTALGASSGTPFTPSFRQRLTIQDSNLEGFIDSVSRRTATDAALSGRFRTGLGATGGVGGTRFVNFKAADSEDEAAEVSIVAKMLAGGFI